jgi:glycosyltransferase involved in cell wall biosynthesis
LSRGPRPILYVHHRPELGGAPQSLYYLIRELDRDRFEPHVYCPPGLAAAVFRTAGALVHEGPVATFTHIWASTYTGRRWVLFGRELYQLPKHVSAFQRLLRSRRFDLVHLNDSPLLPAAWLARRAGIPVVWHLRSALPGNGADPRSKLIRSTIRRLGSASIAINEDVARTFAVGANVVPNSVDLERFRPGDPRVAKRELGLPPDRPVISYFGFIYPSKGFHDFIRAASLLSARGCEAVYLIVGGPVRGAEFFETLFGRALMALDLAHDHDREARRVVAELGLDADVRFVPFTADPGVLYQASDAVVAPSRGPELGRPVIEAAACGRVVVASGSVTGAGLIIPDETGYLVPRRSPDVLAAALERLVRDEDLRNRLGERARLHAETNFTPAGNAARVMGVYEQVLGATG